MAIGPNVLKASIKSEALKFEQEIDETLKTKRMYGNSVTIPAPNGMTSAHFDLIEQSYLNTGWTSVKWTSASSQHHGFYIEFDCTKKYNQWDR